MPTLIRFFKLDEHDTTVRKEVVGGVTTFLTMAYILFVNPNILSATGMDKGALITVTALASCFGTLLVGLWVNVPFAMAPGMGLNAFFAFTLVLGNKVSWQTALGVVFLSGVFFLILTLCGIRERIVNAIPLALRLAVAAGIGVFITFIGLHLLAYPDELERFVRREAQALIIQNLAKEFFDLGHEVVILGDVNDFDSVVCDAADNDPRSCVDLLFKDIDPDADGDELFNAAASIPQAQRYTYWYDENRNGIDDGPEEHSMIDHMYVTRGLLEAIIDIRIDHAGYEARTVSDHWPIIATFDLP